MNPQQLLANRNAILFLAIVLGLLLGDLTTMTEPLIIPALMAALTLSTLSIPNRVFRAPYAIIKSAGVGVLLNYGLLSPLFVLGSFLNSSDPSLHAGLIMLAVAPPAIAIIPFTEFLNGEKTFSLQAMIGVYLAALLLMPALSFALMDRSVFNPGQLVMSIILLIALPLLISRVILLLRPAGIPGSLRGTLTNWCFFLVITTIIGLNRDYLFTHPRAILPLSAIAFTTTFVLGFCIRSWGRLLGKNKELVTSWVLMGTLKNSGLAGGMAIALADSRAALPSAVTTIFMILFVIVNDVFRHPD